MLFAVAFAAFAVAAAPAEIDANAAQHETAVDAEDASFAAAMESLDRHPSGRGVDARDAALHSGIGAGLGVVAGDVVGGVAGGLVEWSVFSTMFSCGSSCLNSNVAAALVVVVGPLAYAVPVIIGGALGANIGDGGAGGNPVLAGAIGSGAAVVTTIGTTVLVYAVLDAPGASWTDPMTMLGVSITGGVVAGAVVGGVTTGVLDGVFGGDTASE